MMMALFGVLVIVSLNAGLIRSTHPVAWLLLAGAFLRVSVFSGTIMGGRRTRKTQVPASPAMKSKKGTGSPSLRKMDHEAVPVNSRKLSKVHAEVLLDAKERKLRHLAIKRDRLQEKSEIAELEMEIRRVAKEQEETEEYLMSLKG
ncbi:hypothetical protein [Bhargavaea ullalensis]|uniref:Uncharacterized protein n=1 Tax=Bhargavaea ullalensis TaxID=1265685 RepID=A0ABV2GDD2_9BACL